MSDREAPATNPYARPPEAVQEPPTGLLRTLGFLGPSFILIGSIVGSGELILTTSFGATVGFSALWFILLACVSKTIVQAELGRYTISSGDTCLEAFNRLPGPRFRVSWFIWMYIIWQIPGLINGGAILGATGQVLSVAFPIFEQKVWAVVISVCNVAILLLGRYRFLERTSVTMVMTFSVITVAGAIALQFTQNAVAVSTALEGLRVQLAPILAPAAIAIAVSAYAGTGVGGGELMTYTYWCVEKGYARYAGESDGSDAWVKRARGWIRVMQFDVWLATVVFTVTTVAFFWLGAGVLHPKGQIPSDKQMIVTIQQIYTESLGPWAAGLFLLGGFFVLYSTIFSGTAGTSRMYADVLGVLKLVDFTDFKARMKWIRIFTVAVPSIQTIVFVAIGEPKTMLVFTAITNGLLIPVIAFSTLWLRYRLTDKRIRPNLLTDIMLWLCSFIILSVSVAYLFQKLAPK